jgi:predicted enzyme related to lactoylglutathione lyase
MAAKKKKQQKAGKKGKPTAKRTAKKKTTTAAKKKTAARHQIVHWEIQSQSPERLHRFYAEALGWMIDANNPMNYGMVASGGPNGIDGGIGGSPAPGSRVVVYASVPSIPVVLQRVESLGGKTIMPRTDIGPVIMAIYQDPEGNTMGLLEG